MRVQPFQSTSEKKLLCDDSPCNCHHHTTEFIPTNLCKAFGPSLENHRDMASLRRLHALPTIASVSVWQKKSL